MFVFNFRSRVKARRDGQTDGDQCVMQHLSSVVSLHCDKRDATDSR